ncbi:ABC transporter permease subunit [Labrys neptuniae]|uniref:ABC transporter permease n=1 Tax=Labrys neptuniae TaxID=376174 RepID=UPI0028915594|nr:ABC transporter permease subunit [Labrys neptuniae]MDT3380403.1 ABC transporter permease subunit [Labrys neptuniae]
METLWTGFLTLVGDAGLNSDLLATYGPRLLAGLRLTLLLVALAMVLGALLSFPIALARMSRNSVLRGLAFGYIYFFRGTPLLAQVYLIYNGLGIFLGAHKSLFEDLGLWWLLRDGFYYAVIAFTLNTAAYQAEILRGGIESLPRGQTEGGLALGLHSGQIFRKIILPQALMVSLRPYGNELILMLKASSVAALVAVPELMGVTRLAFSRTFDFQAYMWTAILYLIMVFAIAHVWNLLEKRLTRHLYRAMPQTAATAQAH